MENQKDADSVLAFDLLYTTNHIQMLKAAMPFTPKNMQPLFAVIIKYMEFSYALSCINKPIFLSDSLSTGQAMTKESLSRLISSIQNYLTDNEKKKLQQIENMIKSIDQIKEMQKVMEVLQPADSSKEDFFSSFLTKADTESNSAVEKAINQIFNDLD